MKILKRIKSSNKINTIAYELDMGNKVSTVSVEDILSLYRLGLIENADLISGGEFRAKPGYHIDTVIDSKSLSVVPSSKNTLKGNGQFNTSYFGEGMIKTCRKIRDCVLRGNITLDISQHKSNEGRNLHLFKLIETCGISAYDFITGYLSLLHPYALEPYFVSGGDSDIWVCELGYRVTLLIKINNIDSNAPIIISFHESNKHGKSRSRKNVDFNTKPCAVFVDTVEEVAGGYAITYVVQRGMIRCKLDTVTFNYKNGVALVDYSDISKFFNNTIRLRLKQFGDMYYDDRGLTGRNFEIDAFNIQLEDLSFISYGYVTINNICMLMDIFSKTTNQVQRTLILDMICSLTQEATTEKQYEILTALKSKYPLSNKIIQFLEGII